MRFAGHKRALLVVAGVAVIALAVVLNLEQLERATIGLRIYRAGLFTPPAPIPGESSWIRDLEDAQFYWDFAKLHIEREKRLKELKPELKPLVDEIGRRQAAGQGMQYSMHIYREVRWRLNFTQDVAATRARIADLRQSLGEPEEQALATQQDPADGSWGRGIDVWYLRFYYTVEDGLSSDTEPQYPLRLLDRINSPEKLDAQLDSALNDDFTRTGEFKREELDETFSAMARLLYGHKRTGYAFDPHLPEALRAYVSRWQNPATGCWGQWVLDRHGRIWKMDDTGITFHVVSDFHGQVDHLDLIAKRLLELEPLDFPAGPRLDGQYENHLNWDLVKVFREAWPSLDEPTRAKARVSMAKMLAWCLANSLQPDGSFKVSELDDTVGDATSYGVSFLREAGYFSRQERFWTNEEFPDAAGVRGRIEARIKSIGLNDPGVRDAWETLGSIPKDTAQ
jgi:hypothetical protein